MERALHADVALIQAWRADRWGNLTYRSAGRNFNPIMAMAAELTVVQTRHIVELGELEPEAIVTPGIYRRPSGPHPQRRSAAGIGRLDHECHFRQTLEPR